MIHVLFLLTLSLVAIYEANACSCVYQSHQQKFCESDFVIKMKVEDIKENNKESQYLMYQVNILETYKASAAAKSALKNRVLVTYSDSGICGIPFWRDDVAVVSGFVINEQPHISICDMHIYNAEKIAAEEMNLRENYIKSCVSVA
ncbi:GSCOCG00013674001-RA-CDS [Cotesia congregata]|nr:GSCOCG00013674001-RA-CDS [Cotesia congregata]